MPDEPTPQQQNPATPINPAFQHPPTGAPGGPAIPPTVPLTVDEYNRYRGIERQLTEFQAAQAQRDAAAEAARLAIVAQKEGAEAALAQQRTAHEQQVVALNQRSAQFESQVFERERSTVLASAIAGRTFSGEKPEDQAETARQLRSILESQFETVRDGSGQLVVREKGSGRPAADVLRESLASPRYAHFFSPTSRGGAGTDGTRSNAANEHQSQWKPGSVEAVAEDFKARQAQWGSFGLTPLKK